MGVDVIAATEGVGGGGSTATERRIMGAVTAAPTFLSYSNTTGNLLMYITIPQGLESTKKVYVNVAARKSLVTAGGLLVVVRNQDGGLLSPTVTSAPDSPVPVSGTNIDNGTRRFEFTIGDFGSLGSALLYVAADGTGTLGAFYTTSAVAWVEL